MDAVPSVFHQYFLLIVKLLKQDDIESCFAVSLMSPNLKFDTRKKMAIKFYFSTACRKIVFSRFDLLSSCFVGAQTFRQMPFSRATVARFKVKLAFHNLVRFNI